MGVMGLRLLLNIGGISGSLRCLQRCCIFYGGVHLAFCCVKTLCFGERLLRTLPVLVVNKVTKRPCTQHGNVLVVLWCLHFIQSCIQVSIFFFSDFIKHALEVLTVEEMKLLVVILWANWKERCAIFHGEQPKSRDVFYANSLSNWHGMLEVEKMASRDKSVIRETAQGRNRRWTTPSFGSLKMNCDGSVSSDQSQVGVGVVFRDDRGGFVGAMGQRIDQRLRPRTAELFAIKLGLEFAMESGWGAFQIEGDCMEVVTLLSGNGVCLNGDGVVVEEVKRLMVTLHIPGALYVSREANMVAHSIARFVARDFGPFCWLGIGPIWLM